MVVSGSIAFAGYSSILQADLQKLSSSIHEFLTPEMSKTLMDAVNYAPVLLILVGSFLALISFFGCCGALYKNRCLLVGYGIFVSLLLLLQLFVLGYAVMQGSTIQAAAGQLTTDLWDKRCLCLDESATCLPSKFECLHPETPVPCPPGVNPASCVVKCRPCKEYFESTVCTTPELDSAAGCTARVEALVAANVRGMAEIVGFALLLQVCCLVATYRMLGWLRTKELAERAEEALLAETYRIHQGIPYAAPRRDVP
mmetsp:Transcript_1610/g.4461  ORF Transcript_1610/g.4461 Transcript_1610/m.4461 type:complete len:256 (+) Transcript_1610:124-891(+)